MCRTHNSVKYIEPWQSLTADLLHCHRADNALTCRPEASSLWGWVECCLPIVWNQQWLAQGTTYILHWIQKLHVTLYYLFAGHVTCYIFGDMLYITCYILHVLCYIIKVIYPYLPNPEPLPRLQGAGDSVAKISLVLTQCQLKSTGISTTIQ